MRILPKILFSAVAFLVACSVAHAQNGLVLRYKMKNGESVTYRKTHSLKQKQNVKNMEFETEIAGSEVTKLTLQKADDKGNLHLQSKNVSRKIKLSIGPLGDYTYDSSKAKNDTSGMLGASLTPVYEALDGATFELVIGPRGEVKELKGYKELMAQVLKDNPIGEQFLAGGSEKAGKLNFQDLFPDLSAKPLFVGDKWEEPFEMELPKIGTVKGKTIYTYDGMVKKNDRSLAKISVASEMAFKLNLKMGAAEITGNLGISDSSGVIFFDPEEGRVISHQTTFTLSGNMNVSAGGQNIPVTMEQKQSVSVELLTK